MWHRIAWHDREDGNPRNPRSSKDHQKRPNDAIQSREPEEGMAWHGAAWHGMERHNMEDGIPRNPRSSKPSNAPRTTVRAESRKEDMAWRGMTGRPESEEPKKLKGLSKRPNDTGQSRERRGMAWHDGNPRNLRSSKDR